jgi:N-carbamoylputrescine amidase
VIGNDGSIKAHYRKMHIPDAQGYREDLYFRRGDRGYIVVRLDKIRLGVAICWDQWFPEVSRILALKGAELVVYPSAIGSEIVQPDFDSRPDWELVMRAQAIMNRVFVAAVNRVGQEDRIRFYGGSFVADPWGHIMKRASKTKPQTIYEQVHPSQIHKARSFFGFFETRRPDSYDALTSIRQPTSGQRR